MTYSRIPILILGMMLATAAHAELPASLGQATAQLIATPEHRQSLIANLESALKTGVEEPDLRAVMRLAMMHKYPAMQAAAFVQKLAAVRSDGLPVALVRDKILEGMAKKVPGDAILAVASKWQGSLKDARSQVQALEARGLKYDQTGEQAMLVNLGAGLRQRYGASEVLPQLADATRESGRKVSSAGELVAAGNLAELFLLHSATPAQALELPKASLKSGYTPMQIQALQRGSMDQLRQGMATADVIAGMRRQFGSQAGKDHRPPFVSPGQTPTGSWPGGGTPGGAFPGGGTPGGAFPGGGTPGGAFPGGGTPGGAFPGGGTPGGAFPGGGTPGGAFPGGGTPGGGGGY